MADAQLTPQPQYQRGLSKQPGLTVRLKTLVGDYDTLETFAEGLVVGENAGNNSGSITTIEGYVANAELSGLPGGRGRLVITSTTQQEKDVWGLEMTEVQKPIRTWHAGDNNAPDLTLLANWEAQRGSKAYNADYIAYKYNGEALNGDTLELAKMIREEGIEYYVVYTPVITCTTRLNTLPDDIGKNIGTIGAPTGLPPNSPLAGSAKEWLKTGDRIVGAIDGTHTRVQSWTGADKWNPNLYKTATS